MDGSLLARLHSSDSPPPRRGARRRKPSSGGAFPSRRQPRLRVWCSPRRHPSLPRCFLLQSPTRCSRCRCSRDGEVSDGLLDCAPGLLGVGNIGREDENVRRGVLQGGVGHGLERLLPPRNQRKAQGPSTFLSRTDMRCNVQRCRG